MCLFPEKECTLQRTLDNNKKLCDDNKAYYECVLITNKEEADKKLNITSKDFE